MDAQHFVEPRLPDNFIEHQHIVERPVIEQEGCIAHGQRHPVSYTHLDVYKRQSQYEKLVKSIQDDKNYFSETDIDDQPYYYQYETYKRDVYKRQDQRVGAPFF